MRGIRSKAWYLSQIKARENQLAYIERQKPVAPSDSDLMAAWMHQFRDEASEATSELNTLKRDMERFHGRTP